MKKMIVLVAMAMNAAVAQAGDNGSYEKCRSASGRTRLLVGQIGNYDNDAVQLTIDGKSLGELVVNESVIKTEIDESTVRYTEADHDALDLVTIERINDNTLEIISGEDPRTNKPLTTLPIRVTCETVYNPI